MNEAIKVIHDYKSILADYYKLANRAELFGEEAEQLDDILARAEEDVWLNFFLNEADYYLGQKMDLLGDAQIDKFKDQMAWLREYLEQVPKDLKHHRELQRLLQEKGFYKGPVDGVFGKHTQRAVKSFQEVSRLKVDGIAGPKTFFVLVRGNPPTSGERLHE